MQSIGVVMVQHAYMDRNLQAVICHLAGMDHSAGVSVLTKLNSTASRANILQNLARVKVENLPQLAKFLVLSDVVVNVCTERNSIAHGLPYSWSPSKNELTYFRDVNLTWPQLKIQPPYCATPESLADLAQRLEVAAECLDISIPKWQKGATWYSGRPPESEGATLADDPQWLSDAAFPWPELLQRKIESERNKPTNQGKST
ncbi:MAG: hypothetical protein HOP13_08215 [Alphaproteobacteria bacterium]|nr:hypothetical protein [Alphaproteobacteria bacterium]